MSRLVINRNNGASDEYGTFLPISRLIQGNVIEGMQLAAQSSPNMTVQVNPGTCLVPTGTYPTSYSYHCAIDTTGGETVTIGTASGSNPRIDYIVAYVNKSVTPSSSTPNNPNNMFVLADVQGTPAGTPVVPTLSQIQTAIGASNPYIILAQVFVGTGVTQITNGNITDMRVMASTSNSNNGWSNLSGALTYAGNNGNKEFLLNTSVNLTGTIQPGMKLAVTRSITPPTQCMNFIAASSQYASNASPSGFSTVTGNFTWSGKFKLASYPGAGLFGMIMCELDSTMNNGTYVNVNSNGQITCGYGNGSSQTNVISNQTVNLNEWVYIDVVVTVASKTFVIYINGVPIPLQSVTGTATSVAQSGVKVSIGAWAANIGTTPMYLNGEVSEARFFNAALTQTQVDNYMAINLTGAETNLVGLWQGGGNFADSTTNGNTLTASAGASAIYADNPYNAIEQGFITAVSGTQITVFTGVQCTIPNEALNSAQYSIEKAPYGFPTDRRLWRIVVAYQSIPATTTPNASWNPLPIQISCPTGPGRIKYNAVTDGYSSTSAGTKVQVQMDSATPTVNLPNQSYYQAANGTSLTYNINNVKGEGDIFLSTQTLYYLYATIAGFSGTSYVFLERAPAFLIWECAYA